MKILVDARCVGREIHGIARHGINVIRNLLSMDNKNEYILIVNKDGASHFNGLVGNFRMKEVNIKPYGIAEQLLLPVVLNSIDFDLYYTPNYTAPFLLDKRLVFTIHDLIHLIFPEDYSIFHRIYYRSIIAPLLRRSLRILTVSESSKRDIMRFFNVPEGKISVVYNGVDERFSPGNRDEAKNLIAVKYNIKGRFLLWVGNNKRHKNLSGAINAFKEIKKHYQDLEFVAILKAKDKENSFKDIFMIDVDNDDDLIAFYRAAEVAVLPSLYEGFCLPVLEAMACGCPVVTSKVSSLPEIAGDSAILVNPEDVNDIVRGVKKILESEGAKINLIKRGLKQAERFSWRDTARRIHEVLTSS